MEWYTGTDDWSEKCTLFRKVKLRSIHIRICIKGKGIGPNNGLS